MDESRLIAERFRINDLEKDLLGHGGMGDVYRAVDSRTGQLVAVKALDPGVVARHPEALERFAREGEALRQLDHPNIVRMLTTVEEEGKHYLIMEYVGGGSPAGCSRRAWAFDRWHAWSMPPPRRCSVGRKPWKKVERRHW